MISLVLAIVLNVAAEGADTTGMRFASEVVNRVIERSEEGDTIFFPKGVYALDRHFSIWGKRKLKFLGEEGTVIRMHCNPQGPEDEASGAFFLGECSDIQIQKFTITTDNPVGCQGRIANCSPESHEIVFRLDPGYTVTGTEHFFQVDTTDESGAPDHMIECHEPIHEVVENGRTVWKGMDYKILDQERIRVKLPDWCSLAAVKPGRRMLVRYFRNGESPVHIRACTNVKIEDVTVERTPSCGAGVAPPSSNVFFNRFVLAPPKGSDALIASNADGIHILGCAGRVGLKDCRFWGLGDDALNIHTMAGELKEFDAASGRFKLILRGPDRTKEGRLPAGWAGAGNEIEVYDPKSFLLKGKMKLLSYNESDCTGAFEPSAFRPALGDMCVNTRDCPAVRIVNCTVENTRARAFLLQTQNVRIRNCTFRGLPGPALIFSTDFAVWNEAGPPRDVEIRDCVFERCGVNVLSPQLGAIVVKANHDKGFGGQSAGIFHDFRLIGNRFSAIPTVGAYITSTTGVSLENNDLRGSKGRGYEFLNCEAVTVDGKSVKSK